MAGCSRVWKSVLFSQYFKCSQVGSSNRFLNVSVNLTPAVYMSTRKHYDPKFRHLRRQKTLWFDRKVFANLNGAMENQSQRFNDFERMELKKKGLRVSRTRRSQSPKITEISLECTNMLHDPYQPPAGDGFVSSLSKEKLKEYSKRPREMTESQKSRRLLKKYEDSYNKTELANQLQSIYIHSMKLLSDIKKNEEELLEYVTSHCYEMFEDDFHKRTVHWKCVETLQPPKIVRIRSFNMFLEENFYAQVTVRMQSKQTLAVYDQFGRLMIGSEHLERTVTEYVIFEKHIVDTYGKWRVHGKVQTKSGSPLGTTVKTVVNKKEEIHEPIEPHNKVKLNFEDES